MCFSAPKPPPLPPPDPALEAQKMEQFNQNADRLAREKEAEVGRQRGLVYGLFGTRSLLGNMGSGGNMLRPPGG
jgi:hypothetical protein